MSGMAWREVYGYGHERPAGLQCRRCNPPGGSKQLCMGCINLQLGRVPQ